jgi:hypothetical protein
LWVSLKPLLHHVGGLASGHTGWDTSSSRGFVKDYVEGECIGDGCNEPHAVGEAYRPLSCGTGAMLMEPVTCNLPHRRRCKKQGAGYGRDYE